MLCDLRPEGVFGVGQESPPGFPFIRHVGLMSLLLRKEYTDVVLRSKLALLWGCNHNDTESAGEQRGSAVHHLRATRRQQAPGRGCSGGDLRRADLPLLLRDPDLAHPLIAIPFVRSSSNLYLTEVPGRGCLWLAAAARESTGRYEKVRVREDHRVWELGGAVGKVVGSYGGEELMVLGVHFPDGGYQLLWPGDVDDVGSSEPWWRCLLGNRK